MSVAAVEEPIPPTLAGLPLEQWAFACRILIAMMLALALAFWLQLDSASSAAVTVAVLAQPRRGQAFLKAAIRVGATIVGVVAAIAITAIFAQSRDLFVLAYAGWMALAVYVAACFDGNRSYGAVLSGYTVAIVAVIDIDTPQNVFMTGVDRLAVIALGIAAVALVDDVLAAPDVYPSVRQRLRAALEETRGFVARHLAGDGPQPFETVGLVGRITGVHLDIQTLPSEAPAGAPRAAAANSASTAMIGSLSVARAFAAISRTMTAEPQAEIRMALGASDRDRRQAMAREEMAQPHPSLARVALARAAAELIRQQRLAESELAAMEAARWPERRVSVPIHRDRRGALWKSTAVFCCLLAAATLFILSSWPLTSVALAQMGIFAGLGATTPNIRAFARGAMIAIPCAAAVAGITEFLILDGADAFPLLVIGMAPAVFLASLLSLRPKTAGFGFLILVFLNVIFPPSNPQSYDPQSYLYTTILSCAGIFVFALLLSATPPITDKHRRRWLVNAARSDVLEATSGRARRTPDAMRYLAADRLVQLSHLSVGAEPARRWRLDYLLTLSNLTLVAIHTHEALDQLASAAVPVAAARDAVARLDPPALDEAATNIIASSRSQATDPSALSEAVSGLAFLAGLSRAHAPALRHLRSALPA